MTALAAIQNALGRAVVLLQPDEARALILVFKIQDVLDRRAAEAVNALVIVTDDADILRRPASSEARRYCRWFVS